MASRDGRVARRPVAMLLIVPIVVAVSMSSHGLSEISAAQAVQPKPCKAAGERVQRAKRCCSGIVRRNRCACKPDGAKAKSDKQCCSGRAVDGVCCGEAGGACAKSACCGGGNFCDGALEECVPCLNDGGQADEKAPDGPESSCCIGRMRDDTGVCCGGVDGCRLSKCCGAGLYCDQSDGDRCVECIQEGGIVDSNAPSGQPEDSCCSGVMGHDDQGDRCCGKAGESCLLSQCCAAGPAGPEICYEDQCVSCLPEGAPPDAPDQCCSKTAENDKCCGELGGSCAASGCCAEGVCRQGICEDCLPEGTPTVDADLCCSLRASEFGCCGEVDGSCANSLCCGDGSFCVDGACTACIPAGEVTASEAACCSHAAVAGHCCGAAGSSCAGGACCAVGTECRNDTCVQCHAGGAQCSQSSDCCAGTDCCNGHCIGVQSDTSNCGSCGNVCQGLERCENGQCGQLCTDTMACGPGIPPVPDVFCAEPAPYCTGFCSFNARYLACCAECPGPPAHFAGTCGDGTCCCGTCDFQTGVCNP